MNPHKPKRLQNPIQTMHKELGRSVIHHFTRLGPLQPFDPKNRGRDKNYLKTGKILTFTY